MARMRSRRAAAAGGQLQGGGDGVQGGAGLIAPAVGAEVPGPVRRRAADHGEAGVGLPGQPDEGVALVVLEEDVVAGHVLLDEGVLQHQGLELCADDDGLKIVHLPHHGLGLEVVAPVLLKVLAHPVFQLLGLAHVDHAAVLPVHQVHPRGQGQAVGLFQQFRLGHLASPSFPQKKKKDCLVSPKQSSIRRPIIHQSRRNEPARPELPPLPSRRNRRRSG